ncbi:uncharacterized protein PFL1_01064 [Pseudozyma flocculosa PF-1]|uniref:MOSC domain-containing protein n=1 Tax=Pseudozyma flocculosa TaxID=84751 RepID=A0A5C3FBU0_9BASI|nr:uncharacterized protein PFL1_01064 [Pseudozyma flocculosa PF-1]EPQ31731.1 hypothetical protein PFL1_01064 [Pseudozyma flocculosa PF-1]SPO40849.1 uncharacterized protein PSFLO_06331 [Pseudozyma flocculosa]
MDAIKSSATSLLSSANDALQSALASSNRAGAASNHAQSLEKELEIKQILIHPIKSCRGTSVQQTEYDHSGLKFDRTWLIIDAETRRFYTARELPKMVLIHPRIDTERNILSIEIPPTETGAPGATIETTLEPTQQWLDQCELIDDITIWVHKVNGYAVSQEADEKLSAYFGKPVRLVRKGPSPRPSGPTDVNGPKEWQESTVRYQDFYPCTVASAASLRHVQKTLAASVYPSLQPSSEQGTEAQDSSESRDVHSYKVPASVNREYWTPEELETLPITRFRPNIIVHTLPGSTGPELVPWEEDGWKAAEFFHPSSGDKPPMGAEAEGKGRGLYILEKCARCMVPNIDPETGVRDNFLPYRVLQQYRQVDPKNAVKGKPCFGMLSVPRETSGVLRVGDIMRITKTVDPSTR